MGNTRSADIRIHPAPGYVDVRFLGEVALAALLAASRRISDQSGFRRGMRTLANFAAAAMASAFERRIRVRHFYSTEEALDWLRP